MLCTERSLVKHEGRSLTVRPLRCKCWKCQHCVEGKKRDLWFKAVKGEPRIFLTLTIRKGQVGGPIEQAQALVEGWRALRQFLCRRLNRPSITFLAVFEKHKSGFPHLHILLRGGYIDHRLIRRWWEHRFQSHQIDIRLAKNARQRASYVSNYITKAPLGFGSLKRYWCSQDWDPPKKEKDVPDHPEFTWWERREIHPNEFARLALADGATVSVWRDGWTIDHWEGDWRRAFVPD